MSLTTSLTSVIPSLISLIVVFICVIGFDWSIVDVFSFKVELRLVSENFFFSFSQFVSFFGIIVRAFRFHSGMSASEISPLAIFSSISLESLRIS